MSIDSRGVTLIELLLYFAISSMLLLSASSFTATAFKARARSEVLTEVEQQGRFIVDQIVSSVESARAINSPASGSGSTLILTTPDVAVSPTIFTVNSGKIEIKEGAAAPEPLHSDTVRVESFLVTQVGYASAPHVVRVELSLAYNSSSDSPEFNYVQSFTTTVGARR